MIEFIVPKSDWPADLANVNALRGQTRYLASRTAPWRALGAVLGRRHRGDLVRPPVRIWAEFRFPTNHRRDTPNLYPTVKAFIDGLVDAGCLPDDRDGMAEGPFLKRVYPNGPEQFRVVLEPIDEDGLGLPFTEEEK